MKKQDIILEAVRMQKTHNKVKEDLFALSLPVTGYKDGKVINTYQDGTVTEVLYLSGNERKEIIISTAKKIKKQQQHSL